MGGCGGLTPRGEGRSCRLSANIHDPPHHMEGACRQTASDVGGVCCMCWLCGALGLATGVCVAHTIHTPPSITLNRSTL